MTLLCRACCVLCGLLGGGGAVRCALLLPLFLRALPVPCAARRETVWLRCGAVACAVRDDGFPPPPERVSAARGVRCGCG